ncbi:MAG: class I SAM-dependent methyltransferase, partial [Clostridia bacterium]
YEIETPNWLGNMFEVANALTYPVNISFTRETWHGRMKACRGIGASSLSIEEISAWEKEHLDYLSTQSDSFDIIHFVSVLDLRRL